MQKWGSSPKIFLLKAQGVLHRQKLSITASVFVENSTHTYSLSEEGLATTMDACSASHASREHTLLRCGKNSNICGRNFAATLRRWTDGAVFKCVGRFHSVVYNTSAVTRVAGHMLSEKSQRTQNGTMFVDLD